MQALLLKSFFLALFAFTFSSCHSSKAESEANTVEVVNETELQIFGEAIYNIQTAKAEFTAFPDVLSVMGRISPAEDRMTVVPARVAGRIDRVMVASGESVVTGQVLATIVSPDYITAREEYLQALKQSSSGPATNDFSNIVQMARKRLATMGLSPTDIKALDKIKPDDVSNIPDGTSSFSVRAPRNGALITKTAIVGNQVNLGDTLFTVADLSKVWFLGDLYPEDLQKIHKNQDVIVDSGIEGTQIKGKVSFISPAVDPTARTVKIRVLMDNPKLALRTDMYVQGGVVLSQKKAILVPSSSLLRDADSNFIFKIKSQEVKDKKVASMVIDKIKVEIGKESSGKTVIVSGLSDGDQVVSDGALLLNAALANAGNAR